MHRSNTVRTSTACPLQEEVPETSQKSFADVKGCPEAKVLPVAMFLMAPCMLHQTRMLTQLCRCASLSQCVWSMQIATCRHSPSATVLHSQSTISQFWRNSTPKVSTQFIQGELEEVELSNPFERFTNLGGKLQKQNAQVNTTLWC